MEGERRRRQVLRRQARGLMYKVFSYFKRDSDVGMLVHDVAKA
jgi:predicted NodU family carbamoyl transferase